MWGEPRTGIKLSKSIFISTHSPRVGRTRRKFYLFLSVDNFNSLAPCGANRHGLRRRQNSGAISTHSPPCGANRILLSYTLNVPIFQLTRPVWGEPNRDKRRDERRHISTHSPRVGRTMDGFMSFATEEAFQLTRPVWGEPSFTPSRLQKIWISTHSPRVGRTALLDSLGIDYIDFNSLAPCGANLIVLCRSIMFFRFQLTRPVWGEPAGRFRQFNCVRISTHSPRVGRTRIACKICGSQSRFQLTRPVWGEPNKRVSGFLIAQISTHSPRVGRTTAQWV